LAVVWNLTGLDRSQALLKQERTSIVSRHSRRGDGIEIAGIELYLGEALLARVYKIEQIASGLVRHRNDRNPGTDIKQHYRRADYDGTRRISDRSPDASPVFLTLQQSAHAMA
jgi:hypothetical protein